MTAQTNLAFSGLGGPQCDVVNGQPGSGNIRLSGGMAGVDYLDNGQCHYLNPFASAYINPDGSPQTDPMLKNDPGLLASLVGDLTQLRDQKMVAFDIVFAGDLFDVPAGTVGLAVGAQWRQEEIDVDNDRIRNNNQVLFAFGEPDWDGTLTTTGIFAEVNIPITETLEVNVAGRFEDFDEIDDDTFDPKVTVLWRVLDSLTLRASAGTSFRAPSLLQAFGVNTTLLNTSDPLDPAAASVFIPAITQGNPALAPEEATTFGIGLSWAPFDGPLEGLALDVDYYNY